MAGFTADLNPKSNSMSLGDMMKMGLYSAETALANRKAQVADEQAKEMPIVMTFMKDQDKYMTNGRIDLDKASLLPVIAPLTGMDQYQKLVQLHTYRTAADEAELGLNTKERQTVASAGETLGYAGVQDPNQYIQTYQGLKKLYPNNMNIAKLADAYSGMIGVMPPGPHVAQAAIKNSVDLLSPEAKNTMMAPKAKIANIGGADRVVVEQPSVLGGQPTIQPTGFAGPGGVVSQPTGEMAPKVDTKLPKLIQEDTSLNYVPNTSGIRALDKYQDKAYDTGDKKIEKANAVMTEQKDLQQAVRQVENYAGSATGAKGVQMVQSGLKWVFGNSDLDSLVKNMAQVQARNAEVMGLTQNVQMGELNSKLSGNEKIDEKALGGVMQQVLANSKAAELYVNGLNKFVEKRGDINGKIQQQKFENKWKEHYDQRIFQVDNIAASNAPENIKQDKIDQITGQMTPKEYDKYIKDRDVIHRLSKGAYQ